MGFFPFSCASVVHHLAIQFARRILHPPHDLWKPPLHRSAAKIQFRRNIYLRKFIHKVKLCDFLIFPAKIRLMDYRFHVPAHQIAELRR